MVFRFSLRSLRALRESDFKDFGFAPAHYVHSSTPRTPREKDLATADTRRGAQMKSKKSGYWAIGNGFKPLSKIKGQTGTSPAPAVSYYQPLRL